MAIPWSSQNGCGVSSIVDGITGLDPGGGACLIAKAKSRKMGPQGFSSSLHPDERYPRLLKWICIGFSPHMICLLNVHNPIVALFWLRIYLHISVYICIYDPQFLLLSFPVLLHYHPHIKNRALPNCHPDSAMPDCVVRLLSFC